MLMGTTAASRNRLSDAVLENIVIVRCNSDLMK